MTPRYEFCGPSPAPQPEGIETIAFLCPLCYERVNPWTDGVARCDLERNQCRILFECTRRKNRRARPYRYAVDEKKVYAAVRSAVRYGRRELIVGEDF